MMNLMRDFKGKLLFWGKVFGGGVGLLLVPLFVTRVHPSVVCWKMNLLYL